MKNTLLPLLFTLMLSMVLVSSCKKETEDEKTQNDLIGTWNIDNSTADLSVGGVDLVTYMTTNFEYTEQEAQMLVNFFTSGIEAGNQGTINFKDDNTYQFTNSEGVENGTWSINNDGNTLVLVYENETDNLTIVSLSSSNLKLRIPTETEDIDLDDDGDNETTVNIDMTLNLSK
ncbi:MAG: DUF4923 family protein [Bacteroidales bacterium]